MKFFQSSKKYSKSLENILKSKNFNTEVNNLLIYIVNHINDIYPDYKKVKVNVLDKDTIILNFLKNIKENVNSIDIIKENIFDINKEDLGKTGIKPIIKQEHELAKRVVDEKNKSIKTHLSPLDLYTSVSEIQPKYFHIKDEYIFKEVLQNILEEGSNLNSIEIMRDFRGFSWYSKHMQKFPYIKNILYQNLVWLVGAEFMFNWETRSVNLPDYIKELKISLVKQYGEENADRILDALYASIYAYPTTKGKIKIEKEIAKKFKLLEAMEDSSKFLVFVNKQKKDLNKKISNIDLLLNNDKMLVKNFKEKNSKLSQNKQIASIVIYKDILEKERTKALNKYDFLTMLQKPKHFLEYKEDLIRQTRTFDKSRKINDYIVELELAILDAMQYKFKTETTTVVLLSHLNSLRYFKFLKLSDDLCIKDIKKINRKIKEVEKMLVTKLCEKGTIQMLSYDIDINYALISVVLDTRILDLEELLVEIDYKTMTVGIRIYDKNTLEKEEIIKVTREPDLTVKLRRKTKLFL